MHTVLRRGAARAAFALSLAALAFPSAAQKESFEPTVGQAGKDVVWVPTPDEVVEKMLDMAQVTAKDYVVDLGSGDGKIAIAAAKRGAKAKGIEYNPDMVALSKRNAQKAGVKNVEFVQGDIFKSDFKNADVITLYLLPGLNERLRPILLDMKPGTRVTSHQFTMGDWEPEETVTIGSRQAHYWLVPAKLAGNWNVAVTGGQPVKLALKQTYQKLEGEADTGGTKAALSDAKISGAKVSFTAGDQKFEGTADGRRFSGTVDQGGQKRAFTATRQ